MSENHDREGASAKVNAYIIINQPPRSPNSLAQSSNSLRPEAETLGRMLTRLALKSVTSIGLISFGDMNSSFSPRERRGPIAASFAKAVISLPEKPG